ncbi:uncharacterized protein LOC128961710 [Oppia nitens]|uniref:uncharacterized protein LOC128961710 n=1 Tax=Oppia nitens TaxID=1686743 RepID=UPI0023D983D6|nr:uncharacterized protein LOC128961710 [Oppia nitens]
MTTKKLSILKRRADRDRGELVCGVSAGTTADGRIFYKNHQTKTTSWLPPIESWMASDDHCLPYGWESAVDKEGKPYFINHVNKTTTYEDPRKDLEEEPPPVPRVVELIRDEKLNFGFVAGSEKPVVVRFVKEGGPSEGLLQAGDQILKINGEDVYRAPREHVIELVKSCKHSVVLTICQPYSNNSTRKSALLTASKKAKLKSNPSRVRFAEGVVINGSPLFCPLSTFDSCVPFMPNVLKVFLENGQTKTFKYDSSTTVQDVLSSLLEKLSIKCGEHFSLCTEHIKTMRRNRLTLLDPKEPLAKIAARPGAHNLRCLFRVMFVPNNAMDLLERDQIGFEYLYNQCCNDVVQERFSPELKYEIALRLAALQLLQHSIDSNCLQSNGKVNVKHIERECGLESFVPFTLLESMKRKELHKLLNHFLKLNQQLCPSGQKCLTSLQAKLHYLKIMSELPSYGAKIFSLNIRDATTESGLLVSPKFGVSHVNSLMRNSLPITLAQIEDISYVKVSKSEDLYYSLEVHLSPYNNEMICPTVQSPLRFELEDRDAEEFVLLVKGYHRLFNKYDIECNNEKELPVFWDIPEEWWNDNVKRNLIYGFAPSYCGVHTVRVAHWSYAANESVRQIDLSIPPPRYMLTDNDESSQQINSNTTTHPTVNPNNYALIDHQMNEKPEQVVTTNGGIDLPSLMSMEILESQACDVDTKNDDIIRRVSEMNQIVADAEHYLTAKESFNGDNDNTQVINRPEMDTSWDQTSQILQSATDSLLLIKQVNGNGIADNNGFNDKKIAKDVINGDLSATESDTDSLMSPNESQNSINVLNALQLQANGNVTVNGISNSNRTQIKQTPSFGLHSPDVYPNTSTTDLQLIDDSNLKAEPDLKFQFPKDICCDSDMIDLTAIPPPDTPDELEFIDSTISFPTTDDPPTPYKEDIDFTSFTVDDSARVVAELDDLCDTLSEIQSSTAGDRDSNINQHLQYMSQDIDDFIESMTVRPPPATNEQIAPNEHYLTPFIIPPPPNSSPSMTRTQDDVIAKFWKVTDDIKKMCINDETSPRLFKREVHSSSSGESGYDSAFNSYTFSSAANDWPVFPENGSPKLSLPTVIEVNSSTENESHFLNQSYSKRSDRSSNASTSLEDLRNKDVSSQMNGSISPKQSMSRSNSWNNLPTNTPNSSATSHTIIQFAKPPIPPCSPSIQEKRRQLGIKPNSPKHHRSGKHHHHTHSHHNSHNGYQSNGNNTGSETITNGVNSFITSEAVRKQTDEIFHQSQHDIDVLLARLEEVHDKRLHSSHGFECTETDFVAAKEALVTESRHFVTASKLFVKCATDGSPQLLEYLLDCVTLLERMYSVGEIVLLNLESQAHITCLVDRLKEVAATYAYTVDTVHKLNDNLCSPASSPYMGLLMTHATSLATSLSALMRTLRAMNI